MAELGRTADRQIPTLRELGGAVPERTLEVAAPLVEYVAPYQTVCNYWV